MAPATRCDCGYRINPAVVRGVSKHQRGCLVYLRAELERTRGKLRADWLDPGRRPWLEAHARALVDAITKREHR
jgi:hypothetical protein